MDLIGSYLWKQTNGFSYFKTTLEWTFLPPEGLKILLGCMIKYKFYDYGQMVHYRAKLLWAIFSFLNNNSWPTSVFGLIPFN